MAGDRILTTHAGSLPRPDDLADMIWARLEGNEVDEDALQVSWVLRSLLDVFSSMTVG